MRKSEQKEKDTMKRNTVIQLAIGGAIGFVIGICMVIFSDMSTIAENGFARFFILIISMYLSITLHMILHEGGHLIGGLISGYQFTSFRVYNIIFVKEDGKLKIKKYGIAGTGGQCLMTPPENTDWNFPYRLYNLFGGAANLISSGFIFLIYLLLRGSFLYVDFIFIPFVILGVALGAMNLIPLKLSGIANDGHNVVTLNKSAEARRAFYIMLHINANAVNGVRYRDIPAEWLEIPDDYNNPLTVVIVINYFNHLMDKHDFKAAKALAEKILSEADKMLEVHKNELRCELLFLELIGEGRQEEIEKLYTENIKKYIKANLSHLSKCRIMYAYHKLYTRNESDGKKALDKFNKVFLTFPYKADLALERELIETIST